MPPTVEQVLALDVDALPAAIAALTSSSELHAFCLRFNLCPTMTLPECFLACDANGTWKAIPLQAEPVFVHALPIAAHVFHQGPRSLFERIAMRRFTGRLHSRKPADARPARRPLRGSP